MLRRGLKQYTVVVVVDVVVVLMGSSADLKGGECVLLRAKDERGLEAAGQPSQPPADRPAVIGHNKSLGVRVNSFALTSLL